MANEIRAIRKQSELKIILDEFRAVNGVKAVALVGRDGFVIESMTNSEIDLEALGAMVATAIGTSESLGREFSLGGMEQYLAEFKEGKILMGAVQTEILAIVTSAEAVVGAVRYAMRKNIPFINKVM